MEDQPVNDPRRNRITVVQSVYFEPFEDQPAGSSSTFSRLLEEKTEVAYTRPPYPVLGEWMPLDTGWVRAGNVGLLHLKNTPKARLTYPTRKEELEEARRVIEVAVEGPGGEPIKFAVVRPGESLVVEPCGRYLLRCPEGTTRATVFVVPG